jgi:hypothetical protein
MTAAPAFGQLDEWHVDDSAPWGIRVMAIEPATGNIFLGGDFGLLRSSDGGGS